MAIAIFKTKMIVKPGDLIKRIRDPYNSRTPTTLYVDVTGHPASNGIVESRGDRRIVVDERIIYPALVVSTFDYFEPLQRGVSVKHVYAFVVWPTIGVGWVWIGESLEHEDHLQKCDRWELVDL